MHASVTVERIVETIEGAGLDSPGICIRCGEDAEGVEPDAERYECESCGARAVYGAEQLLLRVTA